MIYVLDSGPLIDLFWHYYPNRFPSLWERFSELVRIGRVVSVDEVYSEIEGHGDRLSKWAEESETPRLQGGASLKAWRGIASPLPLLRIHLRPQGGVFCGIFINS